MWIGNEDGEIFIFNYLDNVRLKAREKAIRLPLPIVDITYVEERVFVSLSSKSQNQLVFYTRAKGNQIQGITFLTHSFFRQSLEFRVTQDS